ncbi:hypothetical protein SUDANB38_03077 [Streptomyces sp. enrichment culture]
MRWLVGWSSIAASFGTAGAVGPTDDGATIQPVGGQLLWGDPDPLWAVGDWRPDEIRVVGVAPDVRLAVLGCCAASDEELKVGLFAARGGALRHLTAWPGSYTAVVQTGRRITVTSDLAGARPVFHTPWANGTAYATAALPLADLIEAQLDIGHLAALLACPETPEALRDSTPYAGVKRVPPGHALVLREGSREITGYEPVASLAVAAPQVDPDRAVEGVRDALVEAVRARLTAPRHAPAGLPPDPGPVPGMGPADRRAARGEAPAPGIGADLSGGSASSTLALLAAGLPGVPGTITGQGGAGAGERLLAVTFNDLTAAAREPAHTAELERAHALAEDPRLHHVVVAATEEALPYADLDVPLTDEPGPALVTAARHRRRLAAGSADHFTGHGARQVLDAHPARLADLLMDRRRRHLLRPVTALARATGTTAGSLLVPITVYRAARRLARTPYRAVWRPPPGASSKPTGASPPARPRPARSTRPSPRSPGRGPAPPPAGSPARRSRKYRFASTRPPPARPRCSAPARPAPAPPWPATPPTTASWSRPPRSAASACTPRSSTTRSYGPAATSRNRCGYGPARAPTSCAPSSPAAASTTCRPAGAPPPSRRRRRPSRPGCASLCRSCSACSRRRCSRTPG